MKKEFNTQFENVLATLGNDKVNREVQQMPITKGQKLTFTGETKVSSFVDQRTNETRTFGVFVTKEGYDVAFSQIVRRGNGLKLNGSTVKEALSDFVSRIDEEYSVVVEDIKKVESSFNDNKQTYYIFKA